MSKTTIMEWLDQQSAQVSPGDAALACVAECAKKAHAANDPAMLADIGRIVGASGWSRSWASAAMKQMEDTGMVRRISVKTRTRGGRLHMGIAWIPVYVKDDSHGKR